MMILRWLKDNAYFSITNYVMGLGLLLFAALIIRDANILIQTPLYPDIHREPITVFNNLPHIAGWLALVLGADSILLTIPLKIVGKLIVNPVIKHILGQQRIDRFNRWLDKAYDDEIKDLKSRELLMKDGDENKVTDKAMSLLKKDLESDMPYMVETLQDLGEEE